MKRLLIFFAFCALLTIPCRAEFSQEQRSAYGLDGLEEAYATDSDGDRLTVAGAAEDTAATIKSVWENFTQKIAEHLKSGAVSAGSVLIIALICTMGMAVFDQDRLPEYISLAGCLAVSYAAVGDVRSIISMGSDALTKLNDFSTVLLPTMCTAAAAGGAITSASAKYAATALFMDILITAANNFIVPLIYAYIVSVIASAAVGGSALKGVTKVIKWLCVTLMSLITIAFTAYLGITGAISGSADAAVTKVTKTAISAALPVVGGIISDAASSVVAGAGILRSAAGAFGMAAVCGICAAPFGALGVRYLLFKAAAACCSALPAGRISELIGGIGSACGMMLGLTGCGGIMLFLSIISSIKAVSGA